MSDLNFEKHLLYYTHIYNFPFFELIEMALNCNPYSSKYTIKLSFTTSVDLLLK